MHVLYKYFIDGVGLYVSVRCYFITGNIAQSATRRYLIYSEADFEGFRPTRCTKWGEIWHGGGNKRSTPPCHSIGATKLKFLLRFDQNVEYKRSTGAYPLRDFHKICRVCTQFQFASTVKISLDLLKGLWSYWGFKLNVRDCAPDFAMKALEYRNDFDAVG